MNYQKYNLSGRIETTYTGYQSLAQFYNACQKHQNCRIEIDLSALTWIDANLCGLWLATKPNNALMQHYLKPSKAQPFHLIFPTN